MKQIHLYVQHCNQREFKFVFFVSFFWRGGGILYETLSRLIK